MRFALSNIEKVEARPGATGTCPGCGSDLIARCGERKVWHWAHKGRRHCDQWWENETQWHRDWKSNFPLEWQEVGARDDDGELHIADVRTPSGLVVEFQHSYLRPAEARKRTQFHNPMLWVVDATRRPTDPTQFKKCLQDARQHRFSEGTVYEVYWPEEVRLFREWIGTGVVVAFDLGKEDVWLLRRVQQGKVFGFFYPKLSLISNIKEGTRPPDVLFGEPRKLVKRGRRNR